MIHVLYHANCCDGFTAAWLLARVFGAKANYVPMNYGDPFPAVDADDEVYMVDFNMEIPVEFTGSVTVFDHHIGAQDLFASQYARMTKQSEFNLAESGASLVYKYINKYKLGPGLICGTEILVKYVKDRDLWIWAMPWSQEINAAIGSRDRTFDDWDYLCEHIYNNLPTVRIEGRAILKSHDIIIERTKVTERKGIKFVNSACLQSEVGNHYGPGPVVVWYFDGSKVRCSVRGNGALQIAKSWGGGGHELAAGCSLELGTFVKWLEGTDVTTQ